MKQLVLHDLPARRLPNAAIRGGSGLANLVRSACDRLATCLQAQCAKLLVSACLACCASPAWSHDDGSAHGDHNPHHGGVVLMYGLDLHYEVVLSPTGKVELWLSNAARTDLPATAVSDVAAEIEQPSGRQGVDMQISDSGDAWVGQTQAFDVKQATLHLGFVYQGEAASVSLPAASLVGAGREQLVKDTSHATTEPGKPAPAASHDAHAGHHGHHAHPAPGNAPR